MQGLILAAGMGKRLGALTAENTKCMIKVNGVTLIERMLAQLARLNLSRIVLVVGYQGDKLKNFIATLNCPVPLVFVENPVYATTNNIYSLALARDYLAADDTVLLESDLILEDAILQKLCDDSGTTLAVVDKYENWMDGTVVTLNNDNEIQDFIPGKYFSFMHKDEYYKTVNVYKFDREFSRHYYLPFLKAYAEAMGNNEYYEQVLRILIAAAPACIKALPLNGEKWYEIDDVQDLAIASALFDTPEGQRKKITESYGGFWRYPKLTDFCYLVNPYFPTPRLMEELQANLPALTVQYPSGMRQIARLGAKMFGLDESYVTVGNGAAEIIKDLTAYLPGKIGLTAPSFAEYANRLPAERKVVFSCHHPLFAYTAEDIIDYFSEHKVNSLILVNPDNPTGNYISQSGILRLTAWAERENIRLIVDESFVDFADETNVSLLNNAILTQYPHLTVIKSISKSYGVPGLRLGILASGDTKLVTELQKTAAIWNINSPAEYFLQIIGKYQNDYTAALNKYRVARDKLINDLKQIPYLRTLPTQANYVMCEVMGGQTALQLAEQLLTQDNIIIKTLEKKISDGEYIRLSVRNEIDNDKLIAALKKYMYEFA